MYLWISARSSFCDLTYYGSHKASYYNWSRAIGYGCNMHKLCLTRYLSCILSAMKGVLHTHLKNLDAHFCSSYLNRSSVLRFVLIAIKDVFLVVTYRIWKSIYWVVLLVFDKKLNRDNSCVYCTATHFLWLTDSLSLCASEAMCAFPKDVHRITCWNRPEQKVCIVVHLTVLVQLSSSLTREDSCRCFNAVRLIILYL